LVRSLTYGGVEYVPKARYCPVIPLFETVVPPGTMLMESRGSVPIAPPPVPVLPEPEAVTLSVTAALTGPLKAVAFAVMIVEPTPTAVTSPDEFTVATEGVLELHVTRVVTSFVLGWLALPNVPVAVNCAV